MVETGMRAFHVALRDAPGGGLVIEAASFEAAAIDFLEREAPAGGAAIVIVCDAETGHEHCFSIDLASGAAEAC
jgi:hypothetical protein